MRHNDTSSKATCIGGRNNNIIPLYDEFTTFRHSEILRRTECQRCDVSLGLGYQHNHLADISASDD